MQVLGPRRTAQLFLHSLSKYGGQNGCMFSVLKASEEHGETRQKRRRPVHDKYAGSVASFVESYYAANQNYPKIALVVRETGGPRGTILRILNELKSGRNAVGSEEPCLKGLDDMDSRNCTCMVTNLPNNNVSSKDSAWTDSDEFEQLAPTAVTAAVEAMTDDSDTEADAEGIDMSAENNLKKQGLPSLCEPTFLAILDQARLSSRKTDANKRVAPLMEVLQQKSSGGRRVNLSACGGLENGLSWEQSLLSIMPTSVGGKQENKFGLKDVQNNWDHVGQKPLPSENNTEILPTALDLDYGVKLMSSKWNSILNTLSASELRKTLKCKHKAFHGLSKLAILIPNKANIYTHAILHFKTKECVTAVLNLKTVTVEGEKLRLKAATFDLSDAACTQAAGCGDISVFHEILDGIASSSLKGKEVPGQSPSGTVDALAHVPLEDESLGDSSIQDLKSDLSMQLHLASGTKALQNTISIQDYPTEFPLKSITAFFSAFGKVQVFAGDLSACCRKRKVLIEFENPSDKEKALMVQQFVVDGCHFQIRADVPSDALVVEFEALQYSGKHKIIIAACRKYGAVKHVILRKAGVLNVVFKGYEKDRAKWILDSLNGDKDLQGTKPSIVFEGYKKVDPSLPCQSDTEQGDLKKLLILLRQLVAYITRMYSTKDGVLNQLAAHIEAMTSTKKDV